MRRHGEGTVSAETSCTCDLLGHECPLHPKASTVYVQDPPPPDPLVYPCAHDRVKKLGTTFLEVHDGKVKHVVGCEVHVCDRCNHTWLTRASTITYDRPQGGIQL